MKVKGGGMRKSWETMPLNASNSQQGDLFGDSNTNQPNGSSSAPSPLPLDVQQPSQDFNQQALAQLNMADVADDNTVDEDDDVCDENAERPKLDEGFYEFEAIRRKRVRKGQLQYFIKWRGWPETANTWEPLENLQSCSDVIDAFEESLQSGKHRKRKRKQGATSTQLKKRQQHSTSTNTAYNEIGVYNINVEEYNGDVNNIEATKKLNVENGCMNASQQTAERKNENEYDPKLSELKGATFTNDVDKLAIHFQEPKASGGNNTIDGQSKVECTGPIQGNRSTGAKRRKSGSVKRFKQEPHLCVQTVAENATSRTSTGSAGKVEQLRVENVDVAGECSIQKKKLDESRNSSRITRIIKPIGYSASVSNNIQDVSVTFMASRSDGMEVMVDNKFLKANNPLLLINFYEQHLRYSPTL